MSRTNDSTHGKGYWPNLLLNQLAPTALNAVWVSDIPYLPLVNGEWACLDLYTRCIVGWRVDNMEDALVIVPSRTTLQARQPSSGLIVLTKTGAVSMCRTIYKNW
ncbi:hypothetical protein [Spirosoma flavum]|uniref:Uncharacterized protein n=1 Tax=Spirosoma flavum TaxID=2048557 RepID=A0ABW6ARW2_9BACT